MGSVSIQDNTSTILNTKRQQASVGLRLFAEAVVNTSESKTPKKLGNLRRDTLKQVLGLNGTIVWNKVYAAAQEAGVINGKPIRNYTTPGTGPHYAENAVKAEVNNSEQHFRQAGLL